MTTPEPEYPVYALEAGPIRGGVRDAVMNWVDEFKPLDFEAGHKAKAWLETNVSAEVLPLPTYLGFSEDESELFGFFVLDQIEVAVAPNDIPIMQVRHVVTDPNAPKQKATKLVWIARTESSPAGFGSELFDHALLLATEADTCALMVDAFDEDTAKNLWMKHYDLREPREGAADWSCLWHAVGDAPQDFC